MIQDRCPVEIVSLRFFVRFFVRLLVDVVHCSLAVEDGKDAEKWQDKEKKKNPGGKNYHLLQKELCLQLEHSRTFLGTAPIEEV